MLGAHWRAEGYTVPNGRVYPWQWLWDSCFHAIVWAELGEPERAITELRSALADQDALGFVPHLRYGTGDPAGGAVPHADLWGRPRTSSITQPPMYGHAVAELVRRGVTAPADVIDRAEAGVRFLLDRRARTDHGLVALVHPWESGCDDSPRWDDWCPPDWTAERWFVVKGELLAGVERAPTTVAGAGAPLANPAFGAGSVGFSALVAFNAAELAWVTGDRRLATTAVALAGAVDRRWDGELGTWVDDGPAATGSGRIRTADSLLPALLPSDHAEAALAAALDATAYGGRFGPAGVHRDESTFAPSAYWRGSTWPQITYLLWCAARRHGLGAVADDLASRLVAGATTSGLAEHWNPDTGAALGAVPQSWTGLALLVGSKLRI